MDFWLTDVRIKYLSNGRHRYKVRETARKDLLSGICLFHPSFALVFVEGTDKGIKHYTNLMLKRIDWTEQARPLETDKAGSGGEEGEDGEASKDKAMEDEGPDSLDDNLCEMIWSGEIPERIFKQFRARHAESDTKAKDWLTGRYEGYWDLAKKYQWKGEDL
jgi:U4/U6 small nuclear ribonucleoprotein PRP3